MTSVVLSRRKWQAAVEPGISAARAGRGAEFRPVGRPIRAPLIFEATSSSRGHITP